MVPRPARPFVCAAIAALAATVPAGVSAGTYRFSGVVTGVDDPYQVLLDPASVGAPVTGFFQYDGSATYGRAPIDAYMTAYLNSRGLDPQKTDMGLNVGGQGLQASGFSETNLDVGDDRPLGASSPSFPPGDSFRYLDDLDFGLGLDRLVNLSYLFDLGYSPNPVASISLDDPTGRALSSQALPDLLPIAALTDRTGEFYGLDFNDGSLLWSVTFRIDSIRSVPEPGSAIMAGVGALGVGLAAWARRRRRVAGD